MLIGYGLLECMQEIRPGMYAGMSRMEEEEKEVRPKKKEEDDENRAAGQPATRRDATGHVLNLACLGLGLRAGQGIPLIQVHWNNGIME